MAGRSRCWTSRAVFPQSFRELLAYFDTDGLSNGGTEAINMLIEKARRLGREICSDRAGQLVIGRAIDELIGQIAEHAGRGASEVIQSFLDEYRVSAPCLVVTLVPWPSLESIYLNLERPQFKEQPVREALYAAIDKTAIIDAIYYGVNGPTETFMPKHSFYHNPNLPAQFFLRPRRGPECGAEDIATWIEVSSSSISSSG